MIRRHTIGLRNYLFIDLVVFSVNTASFNWKTKFIQVFISASSNRLFIYFLAEELQRPRHNVAAPEMVPGGWSNASNNNNNSANNNNTTNNNNTANNNNNTTNSSNHSQNIRQLEREREFMRQRQLEIRTQDLLMRQNQQAMELQVDPFLSGATDHTRQESTDSGLSLSSNNVSLQQNSDFLSNIDDNMDCLSGE